jgi:putative oxidoreductase
MKNKIQLVLTVITGLLFVNGGLNKFFNYMPVPDNLPVALVNDFHALMEIVWLMPLIGAAEVAGGLLIIFPRTRALGLLILFPVLVGILLTHMFVDASGLPMALIIAGIIGWNILSNRAKFLPLLSTAK